MKKKRTYTEIAGGLVNVGMILDRARNPISTKSILSSEGERTATAREFNNKNHYQKCPFPRFSCFVRSNIDDRH